MRVKCDSLNILTEDYETGKVVNDEKELLSQVFSESLDRKVHTTKTKAKAKPKNKVTLKKPSEKIVIKTITE